MAKQTNAPDKDDNTVHRADLFRAMPRESTLSNRVTEEIEAIITGTQLQPGDRLPAERELARQFGVSRTVIREAVRALMAKGLLEVHSGSGTIIRSPSVASVSQSMTLLLRAGQPQLDYRKVLEVRSLLEGEIAGRAAERRTDEDLERMADNLAQTLSITEREQFVRVDMAFHAALAQATRNELYSVLLDSIAEVMRKIREMAFDILGAPNRSYKYHSAIFEQVQQGNAEGARRAMREHLIEAEETVLRALARHAMRSFDQPESPDS